MNRLLKQRWKAKPCDKIWWIVYSDVCIRVRALALSLMYPHGVSGASSVFVDRNGSCIACSHSQRIKQHTHAHRPDSYCDDRHEKLLIFIFRYVKANKKWLIIFSLLLLLFCFVFSHLPSCRSGIAISASNPHTRYTFAYLSFGSEVWCTRAHLQTRDPQACTRQWEKEMKTNLLRCELNTFVNK